MRFLQGVILCALLCPVWPFVALAWCIGALVFAAQWLLVRAGVGKFVEQSSYDHAYHPKF